MNSFPLQENKATQKKKYSSTRDVKVQQQEQTKKKKGKYITM